MRVGLRFTELTPMVPRAVEGDTQTVQLMGRLDPGGVISMIESMASVAAYTWLNSPENSGGGTW